MIKSRKYRSELLSSRRKNNQSKPVPSWRTSLFCIFWIDWRFLLLLKFTIIFSPMNAPPAQSSLSPVPLLIKPCIVLIIDKKRNQSTT